MNVKFYTFSKRRNSTKQPTGTGTVKACKLKDNCSIHEPVLILADNTMSYNYAYIQTWSRYYFVADVIYLANNLVEYHLTEDVLASHKTAIGSTKAMIAYASNHYNYFIVDPRIQVSTATAPQNVTINSVDGAPASIFNNDHYLLTVFNGSGYAAAGLCSTYYMLPMEIGQLRAWLCDTTVMSDLGTFFNGNPLTAISSCKWIPYGIPAAKLSANVNAYIGTKNSNITTDQIIEYGRITYKYKMQWDFYSDFRRVSPYSKGLLYLPGVGNVEVNFADYIGSDYLYVKVNIEYLTGDVTYYLMNKTNSIIATYSCNVASDIPIGWTTANVSGVANSMIGVIGGVGATLFGAATGNAFAAAGGASTALASASNMALAANQKTTTVTGGMSSRAVSAEPAIKFVAFLPSTTNPDNVDYVATQGRPVGEVNTINTYSGYVQTIDAHVALAASDREIEEVNNLLNSGIYYE